MLHAALRSVLTLWLLICFTAGHAQSQVAVTIDDLPCAGCSAEEVVAVNARLLDVLAAHQVRAVGFVNEVSCYHDGVLDSTYWGVLDIWLARGHELGNHTYDHPSAHQVSFDTYERAVVKGEQLLRPLTAARQSPLRYFRHPYLHAGATVSRRDSIEHMLQVHGYQVAPVTMDNDEYMFAFCYAHARRKGNDTLAQRIVDAYLTYMDTVIQFQEQRAKAFLGRPIPHILLLHANRLNADHLGELLDRMEARGTTFIRTEQALTDPAYSLPAATTKAGFSWIRRWELAAGTKPPWPPDPPKWIERMVEELQAQQR